MKLRDFDFATELKLPVDIATETLAFLGRKGRGKTYGAQRWFELLFSAGVQCVALDPVGNWWSLRVGASGGPGLAVYVFGGPHGDVPLTPDKGAYIARVIVETGISVVLDVSRFRKAERKRFMTAFAEEFFHLKKDAVSPVHLFVEEAHVFCPQRPREGEEPMLGAMEDVVRIGRNYGIGVTLISQRAATVNKDVLSQVECLIAYQTSSAQDKKAIKEWIEENEDEDAIALLKELKKLARGEALFWSPSVLRKFLKIHVTTKTTLDASSTPKVGERARKAAKLVAVDLDKIRESMQEVVEQAEANDVGALKRKVKLLEAELAKRVPAPKVKEIKTKEAVMIITPKMLARVEKLAERVGKDAEKIDTIRDRMAQAQQVVVSEVGNLVTEIRATVKKITTQYVPNSALPPAQRAEVVCAPTRKTEVVTADPPAEGEWTPPQGARMIMAVLARAGASGLPRRDTAIKAIMTPSSGTFTTYISKLKSGGYVGEVNGNLVLLKSLPSLPTPPEPGDALIEEWVKEFDGKAKDIFRAVTREYPTQLPRHEIAQKVDMPPDSGTFTTYMSRISGKGLFEKHGRLIQASPALMEL